MKSKIVHHVEVIKDKNKKWYWRMHACNGKLLAHSESYSGKMRCIDTADAVSEQLGLGTARIRLDVQEVKK